MQNNDTKAVLWIKITKDCLLNGYHALNILIFGARHSNIIFFSTFGGKEGA